MSITDELNQIATTMGKPNLISDQSTATSEIKNAYQNYSAEKEVAKSRIFNDPTVNQLGQYEQQVTQQLFTEPTSYLTEMSNPDSPNYVADPMARLNFATQRQGTVISKLLGIKRSIEKRKGDLKELLDAWTEEYEYNLAGKKFAKEELDDAYSLAWDIMSEQQRRKEKQQELALEGLKKQENKTADTANIWNQIYASADTEDDIWNAINQNDAAWRAQGIDVDSLWKAHKELSEKVGYGGKVGAGLKEKVTTTPMNDDKKKIVGLVDELLKSETKPITGTSQIGALIPGSGAQYPLSIYNQIRSLLSLENRQKLKGSGAISDYEMGVLEQASSKLNRSLSDEDFRKVLEQLKIELGGASDNQSGTKVINVGRFSVEVE